MKPRVIKLTQEQTYKLGWGIPDSVDVSEYGNIAVLAPSGNFTYKGACCCGRCNNIVKDIIYYVPMFNETYCKKCYDQMDYTFTDHDFTWENYNYEKFLNDCIYKGIDYSDDSFNKVVEII